MKMFTPEYLIPADTRVLVLWFKPNRDPFIRKISFSFFIIIQLNTIQVERRIIKGTVSVIQSDPPCKDGNDWFTMVP